MKQTLFFAVALFFNLLATAQTTNFAAMTAQNPANFLNGATTAKAQRGENGFFNLLAGGIVTRDVAKDYHFGGQVDAMLNFGRVSVGALGSYHKADSVASTPIIPYLRLNLTKVIAIQGGYGWFMNDFDFDFNTQNMGYYGAAVFGGSKVSLEVGAYFPEQRERELKAALRVRLYKL
jgi:hypothetical protein